MPTPEEITDALTNRYTEFNEGRDINAVADAIENYRRYHEAQLNNLSPEGQKMLRGILSDLDPTGKFDACFEYIRTHSSF